MTMLAFLCLIFACGCSHSAESQDQTATLLRIDHEASQTVLVASRTSGVRSEALVSPIGYKYTQNFIEDTVDIQLSRLPEEPKIIWSRTHPTTGAEYKCLSRLSRLMLYDVALEDNGDVWVLYSMNTRVFLDRIEQDDVAAYSVTTTIPILNQVDSGVYPSPRMTLGLPHCWGGAKITRFRGLFLDGGGSCGTMQRSTFPRMRGERRFSSC